MELNYKNKNNNDKMFNYMHYAFVILGLCITFYTTISNPLNWWKILSLIFAFSVLFTLRHFLISNTSVWSVLSPYIEIIILLPISLFTKSALSLWLVLMVSIDVVIDYKWKYCIIYSFINYLLYIAFYLLKLGPRSLWEGIVLIVVGAIQYTIILSVGFIAKKFYIQNNQYKELMAQKKAQMLELEQMAILKERNRMAGEIHDTVGHQLTTALVQIEATDMLMDKDSEQAKRRLNIVRDQVKMGLNELRSSIRALKDENIMEDYKTKLEDLAERVRNTTGIEVTSTFLEVEQIPTPCRKVIYYMSMEAMTNAIRHGQCRKIWWCVIVQSDKIEVSIENDGIIPITIDPGFGLKRMQEQVESVNGELNHLKGTHGFMIKAEFCYNKGGES